VSKTPIDLHLITGHPEKYFDRINAQNIEMVTLQYEDLNGYRYTGGLTGRMGLSIVTDTEVSVFQSDAEYYDFVLMMATIPGQSGGAFDKTNFRKIRQFRHQFPTKQVHVDGGVNGEVSFILRNMGVEAAVVGSYLYRDQPVGAALLNLRINTVESQFAVRDFMRLREESPILGPEKRSLKEVLQCIEDFKLGFAILEAEDRSLEGIVSNADLRRELLRKVDAKHNIQVDGMINRNPISIQESSTVKGMLDHIKKFDFPINYLPVLDDQRRVVGVVSFLNLVKGEL
jgi:pentose-5-phosphate-3-epimerase